MVPTIDARKCNSCSGAAQVARSFAVFAVGRTGRLAPFRYKVRDMGRWSRD